MNQGEEQVYGAANRVLYALDRAMVEQAAGAYSESHRYFESAKLEAKKLYSKSLTTEAWALATSDNALPYVGEDFERALVHIMDAFGYLAENKPEEARVEARQVATRLAEASAQYQTSPFRHRDDAFCHWLAGFLFESDHDDLQALSDAWIEVRRAIEIYVRDAKREGVVATVPQGVVAFGLELTRRLGSAFKGEHESLATQFPDVAYFEPAKTRALGRVVALIETGHAPRKRDAYWDAPVGLDVLRIAYPQFVARPDPVAQVQMRPVGTTRWASVELGEDVVRVAIENLEDHMERIRGRATARAVAKYIAGTAAEVVGLGRGGQAGALLYAAGALWNVGNALTAKADKRSWATLPGALWMGQMWLTPGEREIEIEVLGGTGEVLIQTTQTLQVQPGVTTFVPLRFWPRPEGPGASQQFD